MLALQGAAMLNMNTGKMMSFRLSLASGRQTCFAKTYFKVKSMIRIHGLAEESNQKKAQQDYCSSLLHIQTHHISIQLN